LSPKHPNRDDEVLTAFEDNVQKDSFGALINRLHLVVS